MSTEPTRQSEVSPPVATVRSAGATDVPALATVAAATFELACPPSMTRERVDAFVDEVLSRDRFAGYVADTGRHVLLAESDGTALGYAMLVAGDPQDEDVRAAIRLRPTVELSKIYVLPEAHGTGAAALLMARSLDWASEPVPPACGWASTSRTSAPSGSTARAASTGSAPSASSSAVSTRTTTSWSARPHQPTHTPRFEVMPRRTRGSASPRTRGRFGVRRR